MDLGMMTHSSFFSRVECAHVMRVVVCASLLTCVLTVVLLPELDLAPTALRTWRIASLLLVPLTGLLVVIGARVRPDRPAPGDLLSDDEAPEKCHLHLSVRSPLLC